MFLPGIAPVVGTLALRLALFLPGPVGRPAITADPDTHDRTAMRRHLLRSRAGQALVEYAVILALAGIGLMAILVALRNGVGAAYDETRARLDAGACGRGRDAACPSPADPVDGSDGNTGTGGQGGSAGRGGGNGQGNQGNGKGNGGGDGSNGGGNGNDGNNGGNGGNGRGGGPAR